MRIWPLKQSTAAQKVPALLVDATDGFTAETGITEPTILISKNFAAYGLLNDGTWAEPTNSYGVYSIQLDATDTATLGPLIYNVQKAGCRPYDGVAWVLSANVYNALVSGTDWLEVDLAAMLGSAPTEGVAGRLAAAVTKYGDVATPVFTAASVNQAADNNVLLAHATNGLAAIKTAVNGVAAAAATAVWAEGTRTLTSFGTLVADIWTYATRTLTSFGTLVTDIWSAATRTLTALIGLGTRKITITITDSVSAAPVPGLAVEIMNSAETVCQWYGTTNASGIVLDGDGGYPYLNDATYKVRATKPGQYTFTAQNMTVDATHTTFAYTAVAFSPAAPPSATTTTVYAWIKKGDGTAYASQTGVITADMQSLPQADANDVLWADTQLSGDTGADGYCYVVIPRLQTSRVKIPACKFDQEVTPTALQTSINLGTFVV